MSVSSVVSPSAAPQTTPLRPTYSEAFWVWARVAALSFGGPAGQIAVMLRILVEEKRWISESRFLHALNYCMLLPGPEAQQLATYIGWLLHRTPGGLTAGLLFILPGFVSILALSVLYAGYHDIAIVHGLFYGLKPAVAAVVAQAVVRIGKRSLKNRAMFLIAVSAFVAIFFFEAPFPVIVLLAIVVGYAGGRLRPETFVVLKAHGASDGTHVVADEQQETPRPSLARSAGVLLLGLAVWWTPVAMLLVFAGPENVYTQEAIFFSKAAVVTFGGAYSVLAYVAQECVETYEWLAPGEMLDGLGMAETTPGPLIQVVQFVGFMGAYRNPGAWPPMLAAIAGAVITTWVTFAPCFLWIFLGAPYIERLRGQKALNAALSAVTAAVVGVVLNLSLWFALHTLFSNVDEYRMLGARLLIPDWSSIDLGAVAIAVAASLAIFRFKIGVIPVLAVSGAAGAAGMILWAK